GHQDQRASRQQGDLPHGSPSRASQYGGERFPVRGSAVGGEPEVDSPMYRVGPPGDDHLLPGVEVDPFGAIDGVTSEDRILPAPEGVVRKRYRDGDIDPDHPDLDLAGELAGGPAVIGEDRGAVAIPIRIDQPDRILKVLLAHGG